MTAVEEAYAHAFSFGDHLARMRVHRLAFVEHYHRLALAADEGGAAFGDARILVLTEDYCVDSVLNLPLVARLAEASPRSTLRIASRDAHPTLAARFPGRGGVSRLPTVIFLGAPGDILGHWTERSKADQLWLERFVGTDPMPELVVREGAPSPELARWMQRRIAAQAPVYQTEGWRAARDELVRAAAGTVEGA